LTLGRHAFFLSLAVLQSGFAVCNAALPLRSAALPFHTGEKRKTRETPMPKTREAKPQPEKTAKKAVVKKSAPVSGPQPGNKAPAFKLPATDIGAADTAALKGKIFVLYFYPKDDTSGCTAEACGFRDALPQFGKLGVTIIGLSKDNLASHEKFKKKYGLTFPLASDETGEVCEAYGTWVEKSMYGRKYMGIERATFLIDGKGVIRNVWRKVSVPGHVDEVRKAIAAL
jgi:peroxiredoxin Q/BCP